jgi:hypothetical protein
MNNIIHPENCHVVARITKDGLWRVSYQEDTNLTFQQVVDNQPAKFEQLLPGHPKPGSYTLTNLNPYRLHQRCAEKFRVGRICLAADAAHLCNPWGGLGLTGGLAECLVGIATGQADHSILDKYDCWFHMGLLHAIRGIRCCVIFSMSSSLLKWRSCRCCRRPLRLVLIRPFISLPTLVTFVFVLCFCNKYILNFSVLHSC